MSAWELELAFATDVARKAGEIIQAGYGRIEQIDRKSRRDVVTDVDFRSEELVISEIRRRFPDDAILAEESGSHAGRTAAEAQRTWVIDPLDGTVNYANGIPFYCVSIGLVADGSPVVGVVLDPARGDCYQATADGPARLNGDTVRPQPRNRWAITWSAWRSSAAAGSGASGG